MMSIAAHIVGTPLVALRQIVAAVILSAFNLGRTLFREKRRLSDCPFSGLVLDSWAARHLKIRPA
jgi:hypothetical protein